MNTRNHLLKIAVTGATGFVGRYVLAELAKHKVEVIAVTRKGNKLQTSANTHWIHLDIAKPPANAFEILGKPDVLVHLAWDGLPNYKSLHHFEDELPKQYFFLKEMVEAGLPALLVTGTCFEYGMQTGPLHANISTDPVTSYGLAKDTLRKQIELLQREYSLNFIWARLFYLYGKNQNPSSLFPQLIKAIQQGDKQFNMSGGEQLRDYLPVELVAHQITALALKNNNYGPVNICSGKPQSVRSLVENWINDNNWEIKLNLGYYPYPDYEPMAFWGIPSFSIGDSE